MEKTCIVLSSIASGLYDILVLPLTSEIPVQNKRMHHDLFEVIRTLRSELIGLCSEGCNIRIMWTLQLTSQQTLPTVKHYLMFRNPSKAPKLEFI